MKKEYDFSKGKRGAVVPVGPGKTRITIRIDDEILDWFRQQAHKAGGGNYQTMINDALRRFIEQGSIEQTLRRVLREELRSTSKSAGAGATIPR
ncbi:MAG TPA: BrnA antitoxin family protein [Candidatus Binataceae bacterium]|nr:BrnA antitoxin family protein [Candidatus Binataceae bacterium]